jgi:hypothetical protein
MCWTMNWKLASVSQRRRAAHTNTSLLLADLPRVREREEELRAHKCLPVSVRIFRDIVPPSPFSCTVIVPGSAGRLKSSRTVPLKIPLDHRDLYGGMVKRAEDSVPLRLNSRVNNSRLTRSDCTVYPPISDGVWSRS